MSIRTFYGPNICFIGLRFVVHTVPLLLKSIKKTNTPLTPSGELDKDTETSASNL